MWCLCTFLMYDFVQLCVCTYIIFEVQNLHFQECPLYKYVEYISYMCITDTDIVNVYIRIRCLFTYHH